MSVEVITFTHSAIIITLLSGMSSGLHMPEDLGDVIHLFVEVNKTKCAGREVSNTICCINFTDLFL